jgi:hypothetical protein
VNQRGMRCSRAAVRLEMVLLEMVCMTGSV